MSKNLQLAVDYFERHTQSDECHITSDGRVFHQKGGAEGFAGTLDDKTVDSFTRAKVKTLTAAEEPSDDDASLDLATFDTTNGDYEVAKKIVKKYELTKKSNSKADIFAAILEAQDKLKTQE